MNNQAARDRRGDDAGKILIGGPGRSGTTLLVQYFTALGFHTGFALDQARTAVNPIAHAGLEHSLGRTLARGQDLPYVAKSPWFGPKMLPYLDSGQLRVQAFIVPLRALEDAAESRRRVSAQAQEQGLDPHRQPGGVVSGKQRGSQERKLAMAVYRLFETLAAREITPLLLSFPRFVTDPAHLFGQLEPLLSAHGVTADESRAALDAVANPALVNTFTPDPPR